MIFTSSHTIKYINIQSNVVTRRVKSEQNHTSLVARGLNPALGGESFKVDLVKSSFSVDKTLLMNTCAGEKQSPDIALSGSEKHVRSPCRSLLNEMRPVTYRLFCVSKHAACGKNSPRSQPSNKSAMILAN